MVLWRVEHIFYLCNVHLLLQDVQTDQVFWGWIPLDRFETDTV